MAFSDIMESLKNAYYSVEDKYYAMVDWIQEKGVPINNFFVEPLEKRGIPSFPIFALLILLFLTALFFLLFSSSGGDYLLSVRVKSGDALLDGAEVQLLRGDLLFATDNTVKGVASFTGLKAEKIIVKAIKKGYAYAEKEVDLTSESSVSFDLACTSSLCDSNGEPIDPIDVGDDDTIFFNPPDQDSSSGNLNVVVKDGVDFVDAKIQVYNARGNVLIVEDVAKNGVLVVKHLDVGTIVYVKAQADGYLPFDGTDLPKNIVSGTTPYLVSLKKATDENSGESVITVKTTLPVQGALVDIYALSSVENNVDSEIQVSTTTPLISGLVTDAQGQVKQVLEKGFNYKAVARKESFTTRESTEFQAGENREIIIQQLTPDQIAALTVTVRDSQGSPASGVSLTVFSDSGISLKNAVTGVQGTALFSGLERGKLVLVNAAKGTKIASATILLANADNSLELVLQDAPAIITFKSFDLVSLQEIPQTTFKVFDGETEINSCSNSGCVLEVPAKAYSIKAIADGYLDGERSVSLAAGQQVTLDIGLYNAGLLSDTAIAFQGLVDSEGKVVSSNRLLPGKSYKAQFSLYSKDADLTGFFIDFDDSAKAFITQAGPPGSSIKASLDSSCSFNSITQFDSTKQYVWVQIEYSNSRNLAVPIEVSFTVKPDVQLDPVTSTIPLSLRYRSFITRGSQWFRNPFDSNLGVSPGSGELASGCNAASHEEAFLVGSPSRTSNDFGAVSMEFSQGDVVGPHQGFTIKTIINLDNPEPITPATISYQIDVFKPLSSNTKLRFTGLDGFLQVIDTTTPINSQITTSLFLCNQQPLTVEIIDSSSFTIDLKDLIKCSDYHQPSLSDWYSFTGTITLKGLKTTQNREVSLALESGKDSITHKARVNVDAENYFNDGTSELFIQLKQRNNLNPDSEPFDAFDLSDCSQQQLDSNSCHHGYLNASFKLNVLKDLSQSSKLFLNSEFESILKLSQKSVWSSAKVSDSFDSTGKALIVSAPVFKKNDFVKGFVLITTSSGTSRLSLVHNIAPKAPTDSSNAALTRQVIVSSGNPIDAKGSVKITKASQSQGQELVEKTNPSSFNALAENCQSGVCENGLLSIEFEAQSDVTANSFLRIYSTDSSNLQVVSGSASYSGTSFNLQGELIQLGTIQANGKATGTILVRPISVSSGKIVIELNNGAVAKKELLTTVSSQSGSNGGPFNYQGNCGAQIALTYLETGQLAPSCDSLAMYVARVFPADVAAFKFESKLPTITQDKLLLSVQSITPGVNIQQCLPDLQNKFSEGLIRLDATKPGCNLMDVITATKPVEFKLVFGLPPGLEQSVNVRITLVTGSSVFDGLSFTKLDVLDAKSKLRDVSVGVLVNNKQYGSRSVSLNSWSNSFNEPSSTAIAIDSSSLVLKDGSVRLDSGLSEETPEAKIGDQAGLDQWLLDYASRAVTFKDTLTWRTNSEVLLCEQDASGKVTSNCDLPQNWFYYEKQCTYLSEPCTACSGSVNYPSSGNCDLRCNADGSWLINQGESIQTVAGAFTCTASTCNNNANNKCDSQCALPRCDSSVECKNGVKQTSQSCTYKVVWKNEFPLVEVHRPAELTLNGQYPYQAFATGPLTYLEAKYLPSNTRIPSTILLPDGSSAQVSVKQPGLSTDACSTGAAGVYEFKAIYSLEDKSWAVEATPLTLYSSDYLGTCTKNVDQPLCGLLYEDSSSDYGSCVNSFQHLFTPQSVSGMKSILANCQGNKVDLQANLASGLSAGFGDGTYGPVSALVPGVFTVSTNGFMISYDGVYDCESGTSNARRHYLFWNPLGQPTNAVAHAISSCTTYYSDASGSDNWNRNPVSHPSTIKAGFNDCTGLNSPNQMITITSEAK